MRVVVFGGTGGSGSAVAEALLSRGATVVLFLRATSKVPATLEGRVEQYRGTATDVLSVSGSLNDASAAVICVGNASLLKRETMRYEVTRAVATAASDSCVRVVVLSALGARSSDVQLPWWIRGVAMFLLQQPMKDHDDQEAVLEELITDSSRRLVVRPVMLTNGELIGAQFASTREVTPSHSISRKDVAHFIADQLFDGTPSWWGSCVAVSQPAS